MITMKGAAVSAKLKEQVEKGLADLGVIFFAEQLKGQMMQELRGGNPDMGAETDDYPGGRESG